MSCLFSFLSGLAKAQKTFSQNLIDFKFECIGQQQTDDEIIICKYQTKVGLDLSPLISEVFSSDFESEYVCCLKKRCQKAQTSNSKWQTV